MTSKSAEMLVAAVAALGGAPDRRERELVRQALRHAPADLAEEFATAYEGNGPDAYAAFRRMRTIVETAGGSRYALLDLCTDEESRHGRLRAV